MGKVYILKVLNVIQIFENSDEFVGVYAFQYV